MNIDFENAIKKIIAMYGIEILLNSSKFIAIFSDIAPKLKKEKKILSIALYEDTAKYFVNVDESKQEENIICIRRHLDGILEKNAIDLIVETFSAALNWKTAKDTNFSSNQQTAVNTNMVTSSLKNSVHEIFVNYLIKFDGIYCCDSSYLRFFPDGRVYGAGATGTPEQVIKWLGVNHKDGCGIYKTKNNDIKFNLNYTQGTVEYWGAIRKDGLDLNIKSNINGYSGRKIYRFYQSLSQQIHVLDFQKLSLDEKRELADKGDVRAELYMGDYFYNRQCSSKNAAEFDYAMAIEWYKRAANHGSNQAMCNIGDCYYYGNGVKRDYKKAAEYYLKAAELGNHGAMLLIADCYDIGKGVKKDKSKSKFWYNKFMPSIDNNIDFVLDLMDIRKLNKERNIKKWMKKS